jgi:hypothetical protein
MKRDLDVHCFFLVHRPYGFSDKYTGPNTPGLPCYHIQFIICFFVRSLSLPEFPSCAPSSWNPTTEQSPILSRVLLDMPQSMGPLHCDFLLLRAQSFTEVRLEVPLPHRNALPTKLFFYILTSALAFRQTSPPSYLHKKF